jgi:hypothetical protein
MMSNSSLGAADRFYYFLTRVMAYLRDSGSRTLIKQTLSDNLKLETKVLHLLLETLLKSQAESSKTAMADFLGFCGLGSLRHRASLLSAAL